MALIEMSAAWFLALLLAAAALHKWLWRARAREAASSLLGLPAEFAGHAVRLAAGLEILAAIGLLLPAYRSTGALLAALVWGTYLVAMTRALLAGASAVDCGCSFSKAHRPLGRFQWLRTGALLVMALAVALWPSSGIAEGGAIAMPVIWITQGLAAFALLALYGALDYVMSLGGLRAGVLR
jgi:hypothetical protein